MTAPTMTDDFDRMIATVVRKQDRLLKKLLQIEPAGTTHTTPRTAPIVRRIITLQSMHDSLLRNKYASMN